MKRKTIIATTIAATVGLLSACSSKPPVDLPETGLEGKISLASGRCTGLCPVYRMTVGADDRYELIAEENTTKPGRSKGALPVNSFRRAVEALEEYKFLEMQEFYTQTFPENCPDHISDLPIVDIARLEVPGEHHVVTFDAGCIGYADRDRLDLLYERLRQVFRVEALVAVGEPPKPENIDATAKTE